MAITAPRNDEVTVRVPAPAFDFNKLMAPATRAHNGPPLTGEQEEILDFYRRGDNLVVEALAGTGKTTTLKALANSDWRRPGLYLAFNKSIVNAASSAFPERVLVTTAHSLAYRAVGKDYAHRLPGNGSPRMPAKRVASILKLKTKDAGGVLLNPVMQARLAQAAVNNFVKTTDTVPLAHHLPERAGSLGCSMGDLWPVIGPVAHRIWQDLESTTGQFYFTHDHYLKIWADRNPVLPYDYIMFDEAQDADPVIAQVVARQQGQKIYVGDQNQAIYGWRGAVDAMDKVDGARRLPLTKSFRFGPAIAEAANDWLELLDSPLRVRGHEPIHSTVGPIEQPRAILCRTNGTALGWLLAFQERNIPVALAPGDRSAGKDILSFAYAARSLMKGEGCDHPDLATFNTWAELVEYVDEEEDTADLKRLVGIINRVGVNQVITAIRNIVPDDKAVVTVSTAHKAKGLEWESVRVADDFAIPDFEDDEAKKPEPADYMLAYVTVTRAKLQLDPGSLEEPELWRV